jgi:hypothetical protein
MTVSLMESAAGYVVVRELRNELRGASNETREEAPNGRPLLQRKRIE